MKDIKPAVKHIIVDARQDPEIIGASVEYSTKEIESWIEKGLLPKRLRTIGRKWIKELNDKNQRTLKKIKSTTKESMASYTEERQQYSIKDIENKTALLDYLFKNINKLKGVSEQYPSHRICALPSSSPMLAFLALFAGKPERIPRKLLETKNEELSIEDNARKEEYLKEIFEKEEEEDLSVSPSRITEKRIFLICNNSRINGKANIDVDLFQKELSTQEEQLAIYLKRTFGPEGLRHVIGLIIGLEENFRQGYFDWDVDEHLERLGYTRWTNGAFDPELKKTASQIIKIFIGLSITSTIKNKKNMKVIDEYFFMVDKRARIFQAKDIISEKIRLVATDLWYKQAFSTSEGKSPQYTKILKSVAREKHQQHPLTIYLSPLLAIFWRINTGPANFSIKTLMEWSDIYSDAKHRLDNLRYLERELDYMITKEYLGDFTNNNIESKYPSQCSNPYKCILTLTPPDWLGTELQKIDQKRETVASIPKDITLTHEEFLKIFQDSGMSQTKFANALNIARPLINALINGKRGISQNTSDKVKSFASQLYKIDGINQAEVIHNTIN